MLVPCLWDNETHYWILKWYVCSMSQLLPSHCSWLPDFSLKPALQTQLKLPCVLMHFAFWPQTSSSSHSSISIYVCRNEIRKDVRSPMCFHLKHIREQLYIQPTVLSLCEGSLLIIILPLHVMLSPLRKLSTPVVEMNPASQMQEYCDIVLKHKALGPQRPSSSKHSLIS